MEGSKFKIRIAAVVIVSVGLALAGLYGLFRPIHNGCAMTYMYPTYIPISAAKNLSSTKYGLYLYHEGWKKIDFNEHIKKLHGVPVLFIPGNSGSYKQVRSLAKESQWAYSTGPPERTFYQEGVSDIDATISLPNQYSSMLDWFAVDLEGEHSAMDGRILVEHTEYVVYAIHRVLDQYKESRDAQAKEGAAVSGNLPKSVILVGHSMGGFVARAALVHPRLRKAAVETIITLSSPHQSPPVALQPSLGHYFASVNQQWRKGYEVQLSRAGHYVSDPVLSNVVVISISGGVNDYQVRSKLTSLDGIVPPTHGFMISSTSMKNVWLSMEHQSILWCNQLVVQVSHTILSLIDPETSQPFHDIQRRMVIFTKLLHSGIPQGFTWDRQSFQRPSHLPVDDVKGSGSHVSSACPKNAHWSEDSFERDLYIQTKTVTVLAMDGRRRWLDIQKLGSDGKSHFVLATNLSPCYGIRIHLWAEKGKTSADSPTRERVSEVTSKMVQIPCGPAPRQIEPGSQTEQPPPSAVFWLSPKDMHGFRFLTISVAPRPTISGRPPPAASMAVGQFFESNTGDIEVSPLKLLFSAYSQKDILFKEDHPIALNLSFTVSLGLLPATLSLKTAGCGIKNSGLPSEESGYVENSRLCKLRCFPPVALGWDDMSGLHVYPNLHSETLVVDSSPALWNSAHGSGKTLVLLLVDPHCAYKASYSVSFTTAASRFLLLYSAQTLGLAMAVIFFTLMKQAHAWEFGLPIPSVMTALEYNLRLPSTFLLTAVLPILISMLISLLRSQPLPPVASFLIVSFCCYIVANGIIVIVILISQMVFYTAAIIHVFFKTRWQVCERNYCFTFLHWFINLSSSVFLLKVVMILKFSPLLVTMLAASVLVCFVHPAIGLSVLLAAHAVRCHNALCSFLTASSRKPTKKKELLNSASQHKQTCISDSANSFSDIQLEIFHHRHALLVLHLLAALMFVPSLLAWLQRIGIGNSLPWFWDSVLCIGVILHGICDSKHEFNFISFPVLGIPGREVKLSFVYMIAGYYSFLSALALAPYRAFYAIAAIGVISFALRIIQRRNIERGEAYFTSRKHSHRH